MDIVNLTPHSLNICDADGQRIVEKEPSGQVARIAMSREKVAEYQFHGYAIPIFETVPGELTGLPAPVAHTIYIVSGFVRAAVPEREDVFQPGELVRDGDGRVVGCKGLSR